MGDVIRMIVLRVYLLIKQKENDMHIDVYESLNST